jgi:predicted PurR-regulated permease PerM
MAAAAPIMRTASTTERLVNRRRLKSTGGVGASDAMRPFSTLAAAESAIPRPPGGNVASVSDPPPRHETLVVDLDWHAVVVAIGVFLVLTAAVGIVLAAPRTLTWCVIGSLLALALNPLVGGVQRRLHARRGVAIAVVLSGFVIAVALIAVLLGPPAARQASHLKDQVPDVVKQLGDLPVIGKQLVKNDVPKKVQDFLENLPARLSGDTAPIEHAARSVVGGLISATATILVTIALLLDGERLIRGARRAVPRRHRQQVDEVGDLFYRIVGQYFAGSLLVAAVAGITVLIVGTVLSVPLAPLLAVWVALFDLVPQIGGAAGGIPFVALAFTQSATTGVIAAVFFVLYLQFENNLLSPLIVGEAVNLSPPATMVAALVGVSAAGVPGALVGVPLMGVAKAVYLEFRPPPADHLTQPKKPRRLPWRRRQTQT